METSTKDVSTLAETSKEDISTLAETCRPGVSAVDTTDFFFLVLLVVVCGLVGGVRGLGGGRVIGGVAMEKKKREV